MDNLFTVLIPIAAVVIIVAAAMRIATHTFKCKRCGKESIVNIMPTDKT